MPENSSQKTISTIWKQRSANDLNCFKLVYKVDDTKLLIWFLLASLLNVISTFEGCLMGKIILGEQYCSVQFNLQLRRSKWSHAFTKSKAWVQFKCANYDGAA